MQDGAGAEGGMQLLLKILADGEEQARRLGELADDPRSRPEHYRGAAARLQCTLGRAAAAAKAVEAASGSSRGTDRSDSPRSADESSGRTAAVEAAAAQERQPLCKRRKGMPRWTLKFRVPDANLEGTPDDGFSWRKYGQKDILGAKFPRGYYRCTYRTQQGCPATKQVQRSDADLCVFDVTYQGEHTCHQKQRQVAAHGGTQSPPAPPSHHEQPQDPSMQLLMGFKDALKVETEAPRLHHDNHRDYYDPGPASAPAAPFSFPSVTTMPFHHAAGEAPDNPAAAAAFSPPGTSYFSAPPAPHHCPAAVGGSCYDVVFDYEAASAGTRVRGGAAESSELGEVVSRATGCDYSSLYHHAELDPHLPFAPFGGPYQ